MTDPNITWSYHHPDFNPETDAAAIEPYAEHPYYHHLYHETGVMHPDWWFTKAMRDEEHEFEQEWGEAYREAMRQDEPPMSQASLDRDAECDAALFYQSDEYANLSDPLRLEALDEGQDEVEYEDDYLAVRASRFAATEAEIHDFNTDEEGNLVPVCGVHDQYVRWDPEYWRATCEESLE